MGNYRLVRIEEKKEWEDAFNKLPLNQQDVFYLPGYNSAYQDYGDGIAECFIFEYKNELALYPFLKNPLSRYGYSFDKEYFDIQGAYGYNGVISSSYTKDFTDAFYSCFHSFCQKENIIAEFTRFHPLIKNHRFSEHHMQVLFNRKVVYIDLQERMENIIKKYKKTTRQEQRWGTSRHNFGVEIIDNNIQYLDDFMKIYHNTMNRLNADNYLFFNQEYFENILNNTNATILSLTYENKVIAAGILLFHKHYVSGHLGGTLSEYIKLSPNAYLYTEMIRYSQKMGCRYLLLGGGTTSEENDSLYKYKQNFSKNTSDFYIGKKIHNNTVYANILKHWKLANPELYNQFKEQVLCYHNTTS